MWAQFAILNSIISGFQPLRGLGGLMLHQYIRFQQNGTIGGCAIDDLTNCPRPPNFSAEGDFLPPFHQAELEILDVILLFVSFRNRTPPRRLGLKIEALFDVKIRKKRAKCRSRFLPRCMECRRGLANAVCLSVRPSVTRVDCDKTVERSVQIYIPYERTFSLVF